MARNLKSVAEIVAKKGYTDEEIRAYFPNFDPDIVRDFITYNLKHF